MGKTPRELLSTGRSSACPKAEILRFAQNDREGILHSEIGLHSFSRNWLRLDCLPPSGGSGRKASHKLELPPSKKDDLKAPAKKSGTTVKKEKPKQLPPKVKGAELWRECPPEFLAAAKSGMVSGRISLQGSGAELPHNELELPHSTAELPHNDTSIRTSMPGPGIILKEIEGAASNEREKESTRIVNDESANSPAHRRRKPFSPEEETSKIPSQDGNALIKPSQSGPQRKGKQK